MEEGRNRTNGTVRDSVDLEGEDGGAVVVKEEEATTVAEMERRSVLEWTERI